MYILNKRFRRNAFQRIPNLKGCILLLDAEISLIMGLERPIPRNAKLMIE
jgi:hypothetical protein